MALTDARKERYGALVEGRAGQKRGLSAKTQRKPVVDGWTLTTEGIEWIRANLKNLGRMGGLDSVKVHRQQLLKRLRRIREHALFSQYSDSPDRFYPMIGQIADLLHCRVDAGPEIWQSRFDKIRRQAESTDQQDILEFVGKCEQAYIEQK